MEIKNLCINTMRTLSADAIQKAKSGHPGLPLGASPMAFTLFNPEPHVVGDAAGGTVEARPKGVPALRGRLQRGLKQEAAKEKQRNLSRVSSFQRTVWKFG